MPRGYSRENTCVHLHLVQLALGAPSTPHPTIGLLVETLGHKTVYGALVAIVKGKGLWKEGWEDAVEARKGKDENKNR